jgi:DNA-binding CsgD family transcriptional regulator
MALTGNELLERAGELERCAAALAGTAATQHGTLTIVEGPAGIGKTSLLTAASESGELRVLAARGSELERDFAFGVVRQLFEPAIAGLENESRAAAFAGAAAHTVPLFESGARDDHENDAFAVIHGLWWLCANLARDEPLLLLVDDAHWADAASLRFLLYLAARIDEVPIALLVGTRPPDVSTPQGQLVTRLAEEPAAEVITVGSLSADAVGAVLGATLAAAPDPLFTAACHDVTAGTPFLVHALARSLAEEGIEPSAAQAPRVQSLGPRSIARATVVRMHQLPDGAVAVARAVSALGADAEPRRVAAIADLDQETASRLTDALATAGILTRERPVDFVHAIVRSAIHADMPAGERARLHAAVARMLDDEDLPAERAAAHLLETDASGDAWVVRVLMSAGESAVARGAPDSAVRYLQRALAEPPPGDALGTVLAALGRAEAAAGDRAAFETHLRRAIDVTDGPRERAAVALDLGRVLATVGAFGAAREVIERGIDDIGDRADQLSHLLEAELYTVALNDFEATDAVAPRIRERVGDLAAGQLDSSPLLAPLAMALAINVAPAARGADLARRAERESGLGLNTVLPGCVGNAHLFAGRLADAEAVYDRAIEDARRRGSRSSLATMTGLRSRVALHRGAAARAEDDARLAIELLLAQGNAHDALGVVWSSAQLVEALVVRGSIDEADAVLAPIDIDALPPTYPRALLIGARGRLRLARGRAEEALDDARASVPATARNPAVRPWRSDAAFALIRLGRVDEAADLAAEELELARSFEVPEAIGRALRAQALATSTTAPLEEAIDVLAASEARLEHAHSLLELGAMLRRAGQKTAARDRLRDALDLAHRCGATGLTEGAHEELVAAGARPRRSVLSGADALTPSERRVAEMAASGMANREIAQALFVTTRTVEGHLTHAFAKLEVTSRTELSAALSR